MISLGVNASTSSWVRGERASSASSTAVSICSVAITTASRQNPCGSRSFSMRFTVPATGLCTGALTKAAASAIISPADTDCPGFTMHLAGTPMLSASSSLISDDTPISTMGMPDVSLEGAGCMPPLRNVLSFMIRLLSSLG